MARTVIDLDARATVLEAAERLAEAPPDGDLALVVAGGAPVLRSAVFLDVLRGVAGPRRLSLVTADARARSLASSIHVPAYASLAALERQELDPTERLTPARRAAIGVARSAGGSSPALSLRRAAGVAASLGGAALILLAVLLPEARVVVAPAAEPLGPLDLEVRAEGAGEVTPVRLTAEISAKVTGTASGARIDELKAKGSVQLENKTTDNVGIPRGSAFRTGNGVVFLSTEDATLPRSVIVPGTPFQLFVGRADVPIEAAVAGTIGNVPAGRITSGPDADRYRVTNAAPTAGGDIKRVPLVQLADYDAAVQRGPEALRGAAEEQLARWVREPRTGTQVVQQVLVRQTAIAPANVDVVGKETDAFEITVSGIATAYAVPADEPRRAVLAKLREAAGGKDVDERTLVIDVKKAVVSENGVAWSVNAKAAQVPRINAERIGRLLAGRMVRDARPVLDGEGLTVDRLDVAPAWWPIVPILDGRIQVEVQRPPVGRARSDPVR